MKISHPASTSFSLKSRQDSARKRQEERDSLSNAKQIAVLDHRFGKGSGAKKERERLSTIPDSKEK